YNLADDAASDVSSIASLEYNGGEKGNSEECSGAIWLCHKELAAGDQASVEGANEIRRALQDGFIQWMKGEASPAVTVIRVEEIPQEGLSTSSEEQSCSTMTKIAPLVFVGNKWTPLNLTKEFLKTESSSVLESVCDRKLVEKRPALLDILHPPSKAPKISSDSVCRVKSSDCLTADELGSSDTLVGVNTADVLSTMTAPPWHVFDQVEKAIQNIGDASRDACNQADEQPIENTRTAPSRHAFDPVDSAIQNTRTAPSRHAFDQVDKQPIHPQLASVVDRMVAGAAKQQSSSRRAPSPKLSPIPEAYLRKDVKKSSGRTKKKYCKPLEAPKQTKRRRSRRPKVSAAPDYHSESPNSFYSPFRAGYQRAQPTQFHTARHQYGSSKPKAYGSFLDHQQLKAPSPPEYYDESSQSLPENEAIFPPEQSLCASQLEMGYEQCQYQNPYPDDIHRHWEDQQLLLAQQEYYEQHGLNEHYYNAGVPLPLADTRVQWFGSDLPQLNLRGSYQSFPFGEQPRDESQDEQSSGWSVIKNQRLPSRQTSMKELSRQFLERIQELFVINQKLKKCEAQIAERNGGESATLVNHIRNVLDSNFKKDESSSDKPQRRSTCTQTFRPRLNYDSVRSSSTPCKSLENAQFVDLVSAMDSTSLRSIVALPQDDHVLTKSRASSPVKTMNPSNPKTPRRATPQPVPRRSKISRKNDQSKRASCSKRSGSHPIKCMHKNVVKRCKDCFSSISVHRKSAGCDAPLASKTTEQDSRLRGGQEYFPIGPREFVAKDPESERRNQWRISQHYPQFYPFIEIPQSKHAQVCPCRMSPLTRRSLVLHPSIREQPSLNRRSTMGTDRVVKSRHAYNKMESQLDYMQRPSIIKGNYLSRPSIPLASLRYKQVMLVPHSLPQRYLEPSFVPYYSSQRRLSTVKSVTRATSTEGWYGGEGAMTPNSMKKVLKDDFANRINRSHVDSAEMSPMNPNVFPSGRKNRKDASPIPSITPLTTETERRRTHSDRRRVSGFQRSLSRQRKALYQPLNQSLLKTKPLLLIPRNHAKLSAAAFQYKRARSTAGSDCAQSYAQVPKTTPKDEVLPKFRTPMTTAIPNRTQEEKFEDSTFVEGRQKSFSKMFLPISPMDENLSDVSLTGRPPFPPPPDSLPPSPVPGEHVESLENIRAVLRYANAVLIEPGLGNASYRFRLNRKKRGAYLSSAWKKLLAENPDLFYSAQPFIDPLVNAANQSCVDAEQKATGRITVAAGCSGNPSLLTRERICGGSDKGNSRNSRLRCDRLKRILILMKEIRELLAVINKERFGGVLKRAPKQSNRLSASCRHYGGVDRIVPSSSTSFPTSELSAEGKKRKSTSTEVSLTSTKAPCCSGVAEGEECVLCHGTRGDRCSLSDLMQKNCIKMVFVDEASEGRSDPESPNELNCCSTKPLPATVSCPDELFRKDREASLKTSSLIDGFPSETFFEEFDLPVTQHSSLYSLKQSSVLHMGQQRLGAGIEDTSAAPRGEGKRKSTHYSERPSYNNLRSQCQHDLHPSAWTPNFETRNLAGQDGRLQYLIQPALRRSVDVRRNLEFPPDHQHENLLIIPSVCHPDVMYVTPPKMKQPEAGSPALKRAKNKFPPRIVLPDGRSFFAAKIPVITPVYRFGDHATDPKPRRKTEFIPRPVQVVAATGTRSGASSSRAWKELVETVECSDRKVPAKTVSTIPEMKESVEANGDKKASESSHRASRPMMLGSGVDENSASGTSSSRTLPKPFSNRERERSDDEVFVAVETKTKEEPNSSRGEERSTIERKYECIGIFKKDQYSCASPRLLKLKCVALPLSQEISARQAPSAFSLSLASSGGELTCSREHGSSDTRKNDSSSQNPDISSSINRRKVVSPSSSDSVKITFMNNDRQTSGQSFWGKAGIAQELFAKEQRKRTSESESHGCEPNDQSKSPCFNQSSQNWRPKSAPVQAFTVTDPNPTVGGKTPWERALLGYSKGVYRGTEPSSRPDASSRDHSGVECTKTAGPRKTAGDDVQPADCDPVLPQNTKSRDMTTPKRDSLTWNFPFGPGIGEEHLARSVDFPATSLVKPLVRTIFPNAPSFDSQYCSKTVSKTVASTTSSSSRSERDSECTSLQSISSRGVGDFVELKQRRRRHPPAETSSLSSSSFSWLPRDFLKQRPMPTRYPNMACKLEKALENEPADKKIVFPREKPASSSRGSTVGPSFLDSFRSRTCRPPNLLSCVELKPRCELERALMIGEVRRLFPPQKKPVFPEGATVCDTNPLRTLDEICGYHPCSSKAREKYEVVEPPPPPPVEPEPPKPTCKRCLVIAPPPCERDGTKYRGSLCKPLPGSLNSLFSACEIAHLTASLECAPAPRNLGPKYDFGTCISNRLNQILARTKMSDEEWIYFKENVIGVPKYFCGANICSSPRYWNNKLPVTFPYVNCPSYQPRAMSQDNSPQRTLPTLFNRYHNVDVPAYGEGQLSGRERIVAGADQALPQKQLGKGARMAGGADQVFTTDIRNPSSSDDFMGAFDSQSERRQSLKMTDSKKQVIQLEMTPSGKVTCSSRDFELLKTAEVLRTVSYCFMPRETAPVSQMCVFSTSSFPAGAQTSWDVRSKSERLVGENSEQIQERNKRFMQRMSLSRTSKSASKKDQDKKEEFDKPMLKTVDVELRSTSASSGSEADHLVRSGSTDGSIERSLSERRCALEMSSGGSVSEKPSSRGETLFKFRKCYFWNAGGGVQPTDNDNMELTKNKSINESQKIKPSENGVDPYSILDVETNPEMRWFGLRDKDCNGSDNAKAGKKKAKAKKKKSVALQPTCTCKTVCKCSCPSAPAKKKKVVKKKKASCASVITVNSKHAVTCPATVEEDKQSTVEDKEKARSLKSLALKSCTSLSKEEPRSESGSSGCMCKSACKCSAASKKSSKKVVKKKSSKKVSKKASTLLTCTCKSVCKCSCAGKKKKVVKKKKAGPVCVCKTVCKCVCPSAKVSKVAKKKSSKKVVKKKSSKKVVKKKSKKGSALVCTCKSSVCKCSCAGKKKKVVKKKKAGPVCVCKTVCKCVCPSAKVSKVAKKKSSKKVVKKKSSKKVVKKKSKKGSALVCTCKSVCKCTCPSKVAKKKSSKKVVKKKSSKKVAKKKSKKASKKASAASVCTFSSEDFFGGVEASVHTVCKCLTCKSKACKKVVKKKSSKKVAKKKSSKKVAKKSKASVVCTCKSFKKSILTCTRKSVCKCCNLVKKKVAKKKSKKKVVKKKASAAASTCVCKSVCKCVPSTPSKKKVAKKKSSKKVVKKKSSKKVAKKKSSACSSVCVAKSSHVVTCPATAIPDNNCVCDGNCTCNVEKAAEAKAGKKLSRSPLKCFETGQSSPQAREDVKETSASDYMDANVLQSTSQVVASGQILASSNQGWESERPIKDSYSDSESFVEDHESQRMNFNWPSEDLAKEQWAVVNLGEALFGGGGSSHAESDLTHSSVPSSPEETVLTQEMSLSRDQDQLAMQVSSSSGTGVSSCCSPIDQQNNCSSGKDSASMCSYVYSTDELFSEVSQLDVHRQIASNEESSEPIESPAVNILVLEANGNSVFNAKRRADISHGDSVLKDADDNSESESVFQTSEESLEKLALSGDDAEELLERCRYLDGRVKDSVKKLKGQMGTPEPKAFFSSESREDETDGAVEESRVENFNSSSR
ncbi:unnamed protein product, partial [Cyprideis torosa]